MPTAIDITGQRYGRLVAVRPVARVGEVRRWLFACDCGREVEAPVGRVRIGNTRSCGCLHSEAVAGRNTTHGKSRRAEYQAWCKMRERCEHPGSKDYRLYGQRGIRVCDRWQDFASFIDDMGPRPSSEHSIDRVDSNGNYEPGNCRWATATEQARNTSRNRWLEHDGRRMTLAEWGLETGIGPELIRARIDRCGWSVAKALTSPARAQR